MKKSTRIIIATLVALVVITIATPFVFFKRGDGNYSKFSEAVHVSLAGSNAVLEHEPVAELGIKVDGIYADSINSLQVCIVENPDTASKLVVEADKALMRYISLQPRKDGSCRLFVGIEGDENPVDVSAPSLNITIHVPAGSLHYVDPFWTVDVTLQDFNNATMTFRDNRNLRLVNSSFATFSLTNI